jgi:hypothetical protein
LAQASIQKQCTPQHSSAKKVQIAAAQIAYDAYAGANCQKERSIPDVAPRQPDDDVVRTTMFLNKVRDEI